LNKKKYPSKINVICKCSSPSHSHFFYLSKQPFEDAPEQNNLKTKKSKEEDALKKYLQRNLKLFP
jgi:hypothetical protein